MTAADKITAEVTLTSSLASRITAALAAGLSPEAIAAILDRLKTLLEEGDDE